MKSIPLVDGENFKGKIKQVFKDAEKSRPAWHHYDFHGLLVKVLTAPISPIMHPWEARSRP